MPTITEFSGKYEFLSNFHPSTIKHRGISYPTNEHYFQALKTKDIEERKRIALLSTPGKAKRAGRKLERRKNWEKYRIIVMKRGLQRKFKQPKFKELLLQTGDNILQEGNNWGDTFWGVDLATGEGENMLGVLLMRVREELK